MFTISRQFSFCYAHRLRKHAGRCAGLHGHNGTVKVDLQDCRLNSQGMVADFIDVKNLIGNWIDEHLDHRTILEEGDPLAAVLRDHGEQVLTLSAEPTAENLAKLIYDQAAALGLPVVSVSFAETEKSVAVFSPVPACAGNDGYGVSEQV